jgi:hypothetical protein
MRGYTHIITSASTGFLLSSIFNTNVFLSVCFCVFGGTINDIDAPESFFNRVFFKSTFGKIFKTLVVLVTGYLLQKPFIIYIGFVLIISLISMHTYYKFNHGIIERVEVHRTYLHDPIISIPIFFAVPYFIFGFKNDYLFIMFAGIILHLLLDMFNRSGIFVYLFQRRLRMPFTYDYNNVLFELVIAGIYIFCIYTIKTQLL